MALLLTGLTLLVGCGASSSSASHTPTAAKSTQPGSSAHSASTIGFEGLALEPGAELAPAASTTPGSVVGGIQCGSAEQLTYHIHAHLAVYVQGQPRSLPPGIGIPGAQVQQSQFGAVVGQGTCFYWLHTHTADGVIHIESPTARVYTLGDFFAEWRQPLSASQVGPSRGTVTARVDGRLWRRSPRAIPLESHRAIQLDVGTPLAPFQPVAFGTTQL